MSHLNDLNTAVAVIGIACRFPDARNPLEFWNNLEAGRESLRDLTAAELEEAGVDAATRALPNFVGRGAIVSDVDLFDARLFGFTPTEAQILDPQQRIFLQCAWEALEDAGYDPMRYTESIGIFAGADQSGYQFNIYSNPELVASVGQFAITLSNDKDHLTTRTAFTLNLKGPAVTVQTNCSTSLVAVCQACQSLLSYQCDIALAGGSAIAVPQTGGYFSREGGIESPDGHCRTFDALARGTVGGNGAGLVVLKRYDAALADGDQIYAVIRGFATNNDGGDKVSYTAPSIAGQSAAIAAALAMADVDAESIGYIEAHGTGTSLGDPIEMAALTEVFRRHTTRKQFCGVGSVKSNIGHLGSAAGVAGLIKTVLALKNRKIPPSLHYQSPNPAIDFRNSPFYVAASLINWEEGLEPRRAGVSSFGVGGTNAHVVLEEAPVVVTVPSSEWQILPISARTSASRDRMTKAVTARLDSEQALNLADAAYTLQMGRREFAHRQALVAKSGQRTVISGSVAANPLQVAMLFPGQGSQEVGMAAELYKAEPVFRDCLDECCVRLVGHLGFDLRDVLYPRHPHATDRDLSRTSVAQPALFVIEYALAKLWMDWGIQPDAMAGHSIGEYVAACLADVFTLEDALALVTERGRLMQSTQPGAMLAVYQPAESLQHLFTNGLSLAAANGPGACVVAGDYATIEHTQAKLNAASISWKRLETSHAFHSASMEPVLDAFVDCMRKVTLRPPALPYLSNLTGTWITPEQAIDPEYWGRHLRETVRFGKNLETLKQREDLAFLEVGPGQSLTTLARHAMNGTSFLTLSSLPRVRSEESAMKTIRESLASLWANGATVNWETLHRGEKRQRISLPTYAFDQQRYWINRSTIALKTTQSHSPLQEDVPQFASTQQSHVAPRPELSTPYTAPRNATEEAIAKLWASILGLEKVGVHDHFLDCGGHSLLAVQMISRLRDLLHVEVSIASFFEGPTVAELARNMGSVPAAKTPLAPQPRPEQIPLSTGQKRLWFIDQLEGSSAEYNLPEALRLRGALDVSALTRSINSIIDRHESLRTAFALIDGEPVQRISPSLVVSLLSEEAGAGDDASRLAVITAALRHEWEEPFDLAQGPLIRARLLQLAPEDHILLVTFHHIVSDAWSLGIFNRELAEIYNASLEGRRHSLDPLPLQYADFSLWEQLSIDEEKFARDLGYWKHQLAGLTGRLALPADRSRPAVLTYRADICSVKTDSNCLAALQKLSQENQATLYMTLLAAFSVLLERYCGQTDFPIATPVSNRSASQLETLIGFFVNSLVMRVKVDPTRSFTDLLSEVRRTTLDAYEHQNVPFERLVDELAPERSLSHAPLSQVVFALQNAPGGSPVFSGLSAESIGGSDLRVRFDLEVHAFESDGELHLHWVYSRDLFDRWRIEQMADHFVKLLTELPKSPSISLHSVSLLSLSERVALTSCDEVDGEVVAFTALSGFEAMAALDPGAAAAICGAESLSYAELNVRANRLAHLLLRRGVRPGAIVGISLPRSFDMLVALLAVLKAGAAYLPLDPSYPQARLQAMIADAQPALVLDAPLLDTSLCPGHNPEVRITPDHPAYVLYTSGSTGAPKGVLLRHAELARYLAWAGALYDSGEGCGAPVSTPLAFDATITSLWLPLLSGKTVFLLPDQDFIPALGDLLTSGRDFTLVKLTPAHLTALADYLGERASEVSARRFVVGGEALRATVANFWTRHVPHLRIVNEYGPTETVVGCCVHTLEPGEQVAGDVPIGRPTPGTRLYVLDRWLEPVPHGVWGELYIGGSQVGAGYLNRTALTAERFLADPWTRAGARMYRTGDQVRRRHDGTFEFEGRTDQQVKIRGFRIEPGEIEQALTDQPGIAQAVVVAREDAQQQPRLVAYLIPAADTQIDTASLRKALADKLPDYMVPTAFVTLSHLPLSPNGKIDRNNLPKPQLQNHSFKKPKTTTEKIICRLFAEVLKVDRIGIDDNFFELGGHSLLATRLVSRIRAALQIELGIRTLFESPTVAELAACLRSVDLPTLPLTRRPRPERLPLSYAQQRLWFLHRMEGAAATYNIPFAVRFEGKLHIAAMQSALRDVIARHETLRTLFPDENGVPFQLILSPDEVTFDLTMENLREADLQSSLTQAAEIGIDIARHIPFQARLFHLSTDSHVLLLVLHHIAGDGWSLNVLAREISMAYAAHSRGSAISWDELPVQYADYVLWQRESLGEESDAESVLSRQIAFWRSALEHSPHEISLPVDRARPAIASYQGSMVPVRFSAGLHKHLLELSHRCAASLFMVLQAGFAALLSRLGSGDDIPIGTVVAGRGEESLESLVGLFLNTLVLRTDLSGNPGFRELIGRVRRFNLEAYAHQDVPFERVVDALHPQRSMARHPLFQVAVTLQNLPTTESSPLPDLSVTVEPVISHVAKFDLLLGLQETYSSDGQPAGMQGALEYSLDLFHHTTAESLASWLTALLEAAVEDPDTPIHRLNFLSQEKRSLLLEKFNQTDRAIPEATLPRLFEEQVAKTPNACAVRFGKDSLTYGELNRRANQLAHHLNTCGIRAGMIVGIEQERSIEMIVTLLGIVKAGGAWLPLDPGYPEARRAYMRSDARPALILDGPLALEGLPESNPTTSLSPQDLAYVIYTSGSTGMPKGVAVTHTGIASLVQAQIERLGVTPQSRVLQFSSLSFDASVYEIVMAFLTGATLILLGEDDRVGQALQEVLVTQQVTHATLTPAVLATLENTPGLVLQALTVAGEACPGRLVEEWSVGRCVIDAYGPTETTVCATMSAPLAGDAPPPIGSPILNTRAYVLDRNLEPVPVGVPGELYIAGTSLARGYLGRPSATAERFVASPYGPSSARMYRTGDLAKWRADGTLDFLGRTDQQIKIRGLRVEPGEIESALLSLGNISQAAVVVFGKETHTPRLAAYVTPAGSSGLDTRTIRDALSERLPAHMVPSAFVVLDSLPLTPNGKVDTRSLPAPEETIERPVEDLRKPRTPVEQTLCDLFASILSLNRVGIHESFFSLGGDSIMSIQLVSRARNAGLEFTARDVFQRQTVEGIAAVARLQTSHRKSFDPASAIGEVIATPILRWFFERDTMLTRFSQSLFLRVPADLSLRTLQSALQLLLDSHDALRLQLTEDKNLLIAPKGSRDAAHCLTCVTTGELDQAAREAEERLDPQTGSVFQAVFAPGRLLLILHHLCVDGVSWRILTADLQSACQTIEQSKPIILDSGTPFRVWANHLAQHAETNTVTSELSLWKALLKNSEPVFDRISLDPAQDTFATVGYLHLELSPDLTSRLLTSIPAAFHAGVDDILLATFTLAIAKMRGRAGSILIDLEGHGREPIGEDLDLSRTVGWFTSMHPVALAADPEADDSDIPEMVKQIKEQLRMIPGKGLGYGLLRYLNETTAHELAGLPQPQIGFNYLGRFTGGDTGGDWSMAPDAPGLQGGLEKDSPLFHLLDVNARTLDGPDGPRFSAIISWASRCVPESDAKELATAWQQSIEILAQQVEHSAAGGHTPSDFPLVNLTQSELERLEKTSPGLEDVLPLTPLQQGLRFHSLYDDDTPDVYTVQIALEIDGELEPSRMRQAVQALMDRHASLRVGFHTEGFGLPVQVISHDIQLPWRELDFSGLDETALEQQRAELLFRERSTRFVSTTPPLLRFALARISRSRHILVFTGHHLLMDGWSMPVFFGDLFSLYRHAGNNNLLPPVRPYADYLEWLAAQDKTEGLTRWREYLDALEGPTLLVPSRGANVILGMPETHWASLSTEETTHFKAFARQQGLTVNTVVQAMWACLLGRLTGREDVVFGVTVSGRPAELAGIENTVGLFINTIPLRAHLHPVRSVASLLHEIQDQQTRMLPYHYLGLAEIQREAAIPELFDTLLGFQNYPVDRAALAATTGDLKISTFEGHDSTHYPLIMMVMPGEQLLLRIDYAPAFFSAEAVHRLGDRLVRLLMAAARDAEAPLYELPFVSDGEQELILNLGNHFTTSSRVSGATITSLFEAQAERSPSKTALRYEQNSFSYEQVNARANQIAHKLIEHGVTPDCLVGICIERSVEMIAGLLGILKAGGAYLPIDADLPDRRRQDILQEIRHVVTTEKHRALFTGSVDHILTEGASCTENPSLPITPQHLAYVNYTSGSTGRPKAVMVPHAAVARLVIEPDFVSLNESSCVLQFAPLSFDAATLELWGPLLNGGTLTIMPPGTPSLEEIGERIVSNQVNTLWMTAGLFNQVADSILPALGGVRQLLAGGDVLSPEHVRKVQEAHPDCTVINGYGPTENTTFTCCYQIPRNNGLNEAIPIGSPIRGTSVYVLDQSLNLVPAGVTGELYTAGTGLARGYHNLPGFTAERFVADPYSDHAGGRMYRTGDLVCWRTDGTLEFRGRTDHQVKLRGFRIEPGEIETALRSHPRVQDSLVLVDEGNDQKQLVAYVIGTPDEEEQNTSSTSHIDTWKQLYESTYAEGADSTEDFNITGWNSSYTGQAIPPAEMRIWVDETVARIRALQPRHVVEIGCGTGLLLTRIAPECDSYLGLDFSEQVVAQLGALVAGKAELAQVQLRQGFAHELQFRPDNSADIVILNSVIQYFPDVAYLAGVLKEAARIVRPGGHIFLGDVRSKPLLEAFHLSVELYRATEPMSLSGLREKISLAMQHERELLLDAALFERLDLGRVELWLKEGSYDNELSRFRYDVTIRIDQKETLSPPDHHVVWDTEGSWRHTLLEILETQPDSSVAVTRIRDRRTAQAVTAVERLHQTDSGLKSTADLWTASQQEGEDIDSLVALARKAGIGFQWRGFGSDGLYQAIFNPRWISSAPLPIPTPASLARFANNPALGSRDSGLASELMDHLRSMLPKYMLPAMILPLPVWPLTANGKIDRRALPLPGKAGGPSSPAAGPRNLDESLLCRLFAEVLSTPRVSIHDNFFELGGHSLLVMQLCARIRKAFGIKLTIRTVFEAPTVAELIHHLSAERPATTGFEQVLPLRSQGSLPPLFCLPPGGGLSWPYAGLMFELDPERPLYGLQTPGIVDDVPLSSSIEQLSRRFLASIREIQPHGPYHLLGWSLGGQLAHCIATMLREEGECVDMLAILDSFPFTETSDMSLPSDEEVLERLVEQNGIDGTTLSRPLTMSIVYEAMRGSGHVITALEVDQAERMLKLMKHHGILCSRFRPSPFDGDLLLFVAAEGRGDGPPFPEEWKPCITGHIESHFIQCRHECMDQPVPLRAIGRILERRLQSLKGSATCVAAAM